MNQPQHQKMLQGYVSIVGIPVTAQNMRLVKIQYTEVPLAIGGIGEDPRSEHLMLIPQSNLILITWFTDMHTWCLHDKCVHKNSSSTTLNSLQSNL